MRYYQQADGGFCVTVCWNEVDAFRSDWPGANLRGRQAFVFDRDGNLIDYAGLGEGDALVALMADALNYGKSKMSTGKEKEVWLVPS